MENELLKAILFVQSAQLGILFINSFRTSIL